MLTVAYGEATLDRSNVYRWYKMFSEGRKDVNDEERAGRPSTSTTDKKINEVEKMILANRRITVREVAEDLNISIGSCHSIFINDLGKRRVAAKFVQKLLNCDQKQHRMNIANEMLDSVRDTKFAPEGHNWIKIKDNNGVPQTCRALIDSGSQANFISGQCRKRLGLEYVTLHSQISGISGHFASHSYGLVEFEFTPHFKSDELFKVNALVMDKLTNNLPTLTCPKSNLAHLKTMPLVDPDYNISAPIDILIGAELAMTLFTGESVIGDEEQLTATSSSKLGWLLSGRVSSKGPKIQQDLFHIILRFRIHPVAINADIAKMYRQIRISQEDSEFQRIVWRNNPHDKIKDYRLETVTYGTSCAPFLATRIIKQLALDVQSKFPKASKIALTDFYVDDLVTGTFSVDEGKNLVQELYGLLSAGGFELRKWTSNVPDVLSLLPNHLKSTNTNIGFKESKEFINVLGLQWQPRTDGFTFKGIALPLNSMTKRGILSQVAKIFDPLGWISQFTTTIKRILKELWKTGLEWDDPIPEELRRKLTLINQDLPSLEHIQIPRCVVPGNFMKVEFHGFCDASQRAYAASLYLKIILADVPGFARGFARVKFEFVPLIFEEFRMSSGVAVNFPKSCGL
ncbi:hypothetical protein LAZ67_10001676 [Cordylochernes scorpioides]|uniref:Peptidase aspartic putative domain-containing protein n=1 Tax=Cordylochernes scorpioides TaxID=51811 RepID=A0ABY6KW12_9ARAC|nr:hypothetical protein LAZ67_10001676 [Cordylochernes scorpioides]